MSISGGFYQSLFYNSKTSKKVLNDNCYTEMGTAASSGSIRLYWQDLKWLYEHCQQDTVGRMIRSTKAFTPFGECTKIDPKTNKTQEEPDYKVTSPLGKATIPGKENTNPGNSNPGNGNTNPSPNTNTNPTPSTSTCDHNWRYNRTQNTNYTYDGANYKITKVWEICLKCKDTRIRPGSQKTEFVSCITHKYQPIEDHSVDKGSIKYYYKQYKCSKCSDIKTEDKYYKTTTTPKKCEHKDRTLQKRLSKIENGTIKVYYKYKCNSCGTVFDVPLIK